MTTAEFAPVWRPALLWQEAGGDRLRCTLCPFRCVLGDGQVGVCQVRRNIAGTLQTATFTAAVSHLDAIERKPLYHVRPGCKVLTVGAPGCTFRCDYCINHRLSQYGREDTAPWSGSVADPEQLAATAKAAGAMLGLSYSEPGLAPELTLALAEHGLPVVWKSNGYLTAAAIELVAPALTAVNIDVKAAGEAEHRRLTGASLRPVLDAVERFRAAGVWVEVSTPLIPGASAEPEALRAIAGWLAGIDPDIPWHLLRFTPDFRLRKENPTAPQALLAAREIGLAAGLRYVYVERALGEEGRTTSCPRCAAVLIVRGVWSAVQNFVAAGRCPGCGDQIQGRW